MQDQELIEKILARDQLALSTLYHLYAPRLLGHISRKVGNHHDAEEILQDTFFAFLEAVRDFHGEAKLETYLFAICNHKIIDHYRRKKFRHFVFSQVPYLEELISPLLNPEEALDARVLKDALRRTFASILPRYRIVLRMKYIDDLSVADIAKRFSRTLKSTESLLFRARKAFMRAFAVIA
jgi:RNA polymerase sigma-70 factor (ECF subfamily)